MRLKAAARVVLALLLAGVLGLSAEDGRDFAGSYKLGEITDLGEQVKVALTVRIHNYSGADVIGAKIIVEDSLPPGEELGSFAALVDIRDRESARASDTFTIPRREYEQWQEGASPQLRIEFTDAKGSKQRTPMELAPMLLEEE